MPWCADDLVRNSRRLPSPSLNRAKKFLEEYLARGPRLSEEVRSSAGRRRLSRRTVQRAFAQLEMRSERVYHGRQLYVYWLLKGQELPEELRTPQDTGLNRWLKPLEERYGTGAAAGMDECE
ncbi:MAG: hypothetical protein HY040_24410 [Planctomycetes bacterium]|nr:hypothetical protein [Planctomycetota bacterium]